MVLPLRTDIAYSGAGGKLTQAGVEAIQGQFNAQAATSAATAAQVATNPIGGRADGNCNESMTESRWHLDRRTTEKNKRKISYTLRTTFI